MKTNLLSKTVGLFLPLFLIAGCDKIFNEDIIWDFVPINLNVYVQDGSGKDLLNLQTEGCIAEQGIRALYNNKVYEKDSLYLSDTRAYLAILSGLHTNRDGQGLYYLSFGEFPGDGTFENEQVVFDWNDGTRDTLSFSSKLRWKGNNPDIKRHFYLNGKEVSCPYVVVK